VYPQGSIALGTVIKPISEEEEYDMDLVSEAHTTKQAISQQGLKELYGREIRAYATAHNMSEQPIEGKRCWTLSYAKEARFHADVLPAIPDSQSFRKMLEARGISPSSLADLAIAITDKTSPNFGIISPSWPQSNPKGYIQWFRSRMRLRLDEKRQQVAKSQGKSVEDVPEQTLKTPLQYCIQLLKRHRDMLFPGDEDKPISIIITTLAAHAYNNEADITEALVKIITGMPTYIRQSGSAIWIPNPTNTAENFADKWLTNPRRRELFFQWMQRVETEFLPKLRSENINEVSDACKHFIGESAVNKALETAQVPAKTYSLPSSPNNDRFNVSHRQSPLWPLRLTGTVKIRAQAMRKHYWEHFTSDSAPLPKHCSLQFTAETGIQAPYSVYWQVVNTGEEATLRGQLRGNIFLSKNDSDRLKRDESTLYTGSHCIECFIVKGGECLARSGGFIVNIQ